MRYTYSSLCYIRGLNPSSPPTDEEIFADSDGSIRAILTSDPVQLCDRLDEACARGLMLLTGALHGEMEPGTVDERLARQVERLREERAKKFGVGVFLFFEANGETDPITPHTQGDGGDFVLALGGLPKGDIRDRHEPLVRRILAAIGLGITSVAGFEKVADATVFFEADGKPIYGFNFEAGAEDYVSRRLAADDLVATRRLASRIADDFSLDRVIRLLLESLDPNREPLRGFLSAWMTLEVFVQKNFDAYKERFSDSLSAGVTPTIRKRYLKHIPELMGDKYTLLDKFVVISSGLDPSEADGDIARFQCGQGLRNKFSHGQAIDENALPLAEIQGLLRKLLRLHVNRS
jgi:hypothetical protein